MDGCVHAAHTFSQVKLPRHARGNSAAGNRRCSSTLISRSLDNRGSWRTVVAVWTRHRSRGTAVLHVGSTLLTGRVKACGCGLCLCWRLPPVASRFPRLAIAWAPLHKGPRRRALRCCMRRLTLEWARVLQQQMRFIQWTSTTAVREVALNTTGVTQQPLQQHGCGHHLMHRLSSPVKFSQSHARCVMAPARVRAVLAALELVCRARRRAAPTAARRILLHAQRRPPSNG
jgi:hypothetical protein